MDSASGLPRAGSEAHVVSGRATIIGNIAANLTRARGPAHGGEAVRPTGSVGAKAPSWPQDLLVERFSAELTAIAGRVHHAANAREAIRAVLDVCREHDASRVLAWAPGWIDVPGLHEALTAAGIDIDDGWLPDGSARSARLSALDPIRVGITGALAGIAGSGTIAVVSGAGRSRLASLLVPVHVAVLRADRLYPSLPAFLAAQPDLAEKGSNLVLITGPSRTADIEMTLTRGVHGPGEIHVVLTQGQGR
jgi:L-lactate dehydrogenase complex protein LldG